MLLPHDPAARLSWAPAALAGLVGAAAFTHTAGCLVIFVTGNTERGALYSSGGSPGLVACARDLGPHGWTGDQVDFVPVLFVSLAKGARSPRPSTRTTRCRRR